MDVFTGRFAIRYLANKRWPHRCIANPIFKKDDGTIYINREISLKVDDEIRERDIGIEYAKYLTKGV